MAIYSGLCTSILPELAAKSSPRGTTKVCRLIVHHMAVKNGALPCAQYHLNGPQASANYYVGKDGDICGGVPEELRAWTTGGAIDYTAITFEISDDVCAEPWPISDATYKAFIKLAAEICLRYGITPHYDGTKGGSLCYHQQFGSTACPGTWLINKIKSGQMEADIVAAMQALSGQTAPAAPTPAAGGTLYRVQVGAFANKANAENYLTTLKAKGIPDAFIVEGTI